MDIEQIKEKLKKIVSPKRFKHTIGVFETAEKLAKTYGADVQRAQMAALLHDCAKGVKGEKVFEYVFEHDVFLDDIEKKETALSHGAIGAHMARAEFGINDDEIISAIRYHTTGKPDMTKLEKIIYIADFIEPERSYPGVDELRKLAFEDIDAALLLAFDNTIRYVLSIRKILHTRTIEARNFILEQMEHMGC
ncbi:putative HD superfamily hydrolase of NAD metabolism [Peptoclostridium litorale DSM 5388]|uniref:bis(5'-nucleosyl)-tetraphosphatase (symmetrical) n=1 Tax=Peptoclostridium litorale DSM 5388 TaxID=1121324 RepID=A0A069RIL1_PEPLI|nr:bis(5'-nucleosyl)-tetraphosphatase (symmetrical) YqeK [Peptoclostridium litorale]KDR94077.1 metal dependent phosphohydrolase [Peptoclostridium litorale DSM 5388]SIN80556.1 putative HD superfamily hydrolase of NAD metabolism [Peptoclostridium litorale DSM 5388]